MRILVFGDSITYGAWDSKGGWVDRLKCWAHQAFLQNNIKLQVINLGVGGNTSTQLLARMEQEITSRHSGNWPFFIIIMIGTNDSRIRDGRIEVDEAEFEKNYREIVLIAKKYATKLLLVGLPPVGKPEIDFKDMHYTNAAITRYDAHIKQIAVDEKVDYLDTAKLFTSSDLLHEDNLHPNDKGHELIYKAVQAKLNDMLS